MTLAPGDLATLRYEVDGLVARITLDRAVRGNGNTRRMADELAATPDRQSPVN